MLLGCVGVSVPASAAEDAATARSTSSGADSARVRIRKTSLKRPINLVLLLLSAVVSGPLVPMAPVASAASV